MTAPRTIPPTTPHGVEPKIRSKNQPIMSIKTTEPPRTVAADHASPVRRKFSSVVSPLVSGFKFVC